MTKSQIINRLAIISTSIGIGLLLVVALPSVSKLSSQQLTAQVVETPTKFFPETHIEAESAIVWDIETGKAIFVKEPDKQVPLASITKVMTALVASDLLDPNEQITITAEHLAGGSNAGLQAGDTWKVKDLMDYKLVTSSNGASSAIADKANQKSAGDFIMLMNNKANDLKLKNTYFINETGLDVGEVYGGSYGTSRDIAKLMAYIIETKPALMGATNKAGITRVSTTGKSYSGKNTNEIINRIPGIIASKTGFTANAGGNLVIAFDAGLRRPVVVVVLGSSREGRFSDVLKLVNNTLIYFES